MLLQQGGRRSVAAEGLKVTPELRDAEEDVCFAKQHLYVFTDGPEEVIGKPRPDPLTRRRNSRPDTFPRRSTASSMVSSGRIGIAREQKQAREEDPNENQR